MSRRKSNYKREVDPDPIYKDVLLAKFVNKIMPDGKKSQAQAIIYDAFNQIKEKVPLIKNDDLLGQNQRFFSIFHI